MKKTKNKPKKKQSAKKGQEQINLNNEIIIGLTPKQEEAKKIKKAKKEKKIKSDKKVNKTVKNKKIKTVPQKKKTSAKKQNPKNRIKHMIVKWTGLIIILILLIVLFLRSSIFNIKEIKVENNSKVSSETIIKLSTLEIGNNMFKYSKGGIANSIKANAYIESVKVKRSINGVVTLDVTERKPTYMLKFANAFVYINNQGYMLELSETPLDLPVITGFKTPTEDIKEGKRLIVEDLERLEDVIKIMNSANETPIVNLITSIDISDKNNYKLEIASEKKTVQFGTAANINIKLLKIQEVMEKEKGISGEIYFQDSERTVFKESV